MPCSFCRGDCRDGGGRFASAASILCRKTPGGGTVARFSMQFARAVRSGGNLGGPGCRSLRLRAAAGAGLAAVALGFLPPLRLQAAAGVRRGFPLRFLCAPFLALSPSAWFGPPIQRESRGGASRARKSAVSGQQSAFWHGASPSWGAPERFHRESNSPTWVFLGRGHPPASREGELCARARFRGQKSKIFAHGAALVRTARA